MTGLRRFFSGRVFARGGGVPHEHRMEYLLDLIVTAPQEERVPDDGAAVRAEIAEGLAEAQISMPYESDEPTDDSMAWWSGSERSLNSPA